MSKYFTPTTEQVRFAYIDRKGFIRQAFGSEADDDQAASTEFDGWLASVKAEAWEQGYDAAPLGGRPRQENPYRETETP